MDAPRPFAGSKGWIHSMLRSSAFPGGKRRGAPKEGIHAGAWVPTTQKKIIRLWLVVATNLLALFSIDTRTCVGYTKLLSSALAGEI